MKKTSCMLLCMAMVVVLILTACGTVNDTVRQDPLRIDAEPQPTVQMVEYEAPQADNEPAEAVNHPIVGTWAWSDDANYQYVFYPNGTGRRGFGALTEPFEWEVIVANLAGMELLQLSSVSDQPLSLTGHMEEEWMVSILEGIDTLWLTNRHQAAQTFFYTRVDDAKSAADSNRTVSSPRVSRPTRGVWYDNVWRSEYLNLSFHLPVGWFRIPDDMMATGIYTEMVGEGEYIPDHLWDSLTNRNMVFTDMVAQQFGGDNVSIMIGEIEDMPSEWFETMFFQMMEEEMQQLGINGALIPGTTTIGHYEWYAFDLMFEVAGMHMTQRQFFNLQSGFIRTISIIYSSESSLEDIVAMFCDLDTPAAAPPVPSAPATPVGNHPLVGTWVWESGDDLCYVFNEDGSGTLYFPGNTNSFTWQPKNDNAITKISDLTAYETIWEFEIHDGALMLEINGLSLRFIKQ